MARTSAEQPVHRFEFTFTPKHGSWLNLDEGFFSKLARCPASYPRCIQTGDQGSHHGRHGLLQSGAVVRTWTYKLDRAA
jgi:hypothetical protein